MTTIEEYDAAEADFRKAVDRIAQLRKIVATGQYQLKFWQSTRGPAQTIVDWPTASELPEAVESVWRSKERWIAVHEELPESLRKKFAPTFPPTPLPERNPTAG